VAAVLEHYNKSKKTGRESFDHTGGGQRDLGAGGGLGLG